MKSLPNIKGPVSRPLISIGFGSNKDCRFDLFLTCISGTQRGGKAVNFSLHVQNAVHTEKGEDVLDAYPFDLPEGSLS